MIQVAIIGTGNISHLHIHAYQQFPERVRIAALVDIIPGKAQKVKEQYGLDCDVYLDHHDVLTRDDINLIDVCTPPYVHAEISINGMKAGKNVICEKPMAPSLKECDEMIRVRDETGVKLSIIAQNRFRKPIRDLKALLDSGIAGPVRHATIDSFWWRGHCYYDLWWRGTWEKEGGGCTLNHAVHHIDMLGWMMGLPKRVTSVLANTAHDNAEVEDLSISILEYDGALAALTASVVDHGEEQTLTFQCEKAKIAAPFSCYASVSKPNGFPTRNEKLEKEISDYADQLPPIPYIGHDGQIENVLTAIEQDGTVAIGAEDGRRTIELITAIYKAGATKTAVELPMKPDDPFYTVEGIMAFGRGRRPSARSGRFHETSVRARPRRPRPAGGLRPSGGHAPRRRHRRPPRLGPAYLLRPAARRLPPLTAPRHARARRGRRPPRITFPGAAAATPGGRREGPLRS